LVEMELKSSSSSPFADVIFATEPTQKLSIHENVSQSEDTPEPCIENYFNSNLSIKPSILPPKQEHAPLS
jgi:hypothetical protein